MKKNKGNFLITIISNFISIGVALLISFFVTRYIINTVSKEVYSFYPIAINFASYFSIIFLLINSLSSRFIMIPYLKGNKDESSKYCSTFFFSNIAIASILFIIESIIYINIDSIINIPIYILPEVKKLFLYIFMLSIVDELCAFFNIGYYVKERMDLQAITSIIENITKGSIILLLLLNNNITIVSFGISLFIAACIKNIFNIIFYCRLMKDIPIKLSAFSKDIFLKISKLSIWSLIQKSGALLISNLQLIISNILLGVTSASELALIQPFITINSLITYTVSTFVDPTITKNITNYSEESKINLEHVYTIIDYCLVIPIIIILSISGSFYKLWIPLEYSNSLFILTIMTCVEYIIMHLSIVNSSILTTMLKVKEISISYLISSILNVFLIFILLTFTNLHNIGILLSAIITYILYHLIYIPKYTKKILNTNNIDIPYLSIKDYLLYIVIIIINLFIMCSITINGYVMLILMCLLLFILDILIMSIIKKIKIKQFIYFLIKSNR